MVDNIESLNHNEILTNDSKTLEHNDRILTNNINTMCMPVNVEILKKEDIVCDSNINLSYGKDNIIYAYFEYLPEFLIYCECYGYPTCLDDYSMIDLDQIDAIKIELGD